MLDPVLRPSSSFPCCFFTAAVRASRNGQNWPVVALFPVYNIPTPVELATSSGYKSLPSRKTNVNQERAQNGTNKTTHLTTLLSQVIDKFILFSGPDLLQTSCVKWIENSRYVIDVITPLRFSPTSAQTVCCSCVFPNRARGFIFGC